MKQIISLLLLLTISNFGSIAGAQGLRPYLEANGKMNVVVLILGTIFLGIVAFLIYLEVKLKKLERRQNQQSQDSKKPLF